MLIKETIESINTVIQQISTLKNSSTKHGLVAHLYSSKQSASFQMDCENMIKSLQKAQEKLKNDNGEELGAPQAAQVADLIGNTTYNPKTSLKDLKKLLSIVSDLQAQCRAVSALESRQKEFDRILKPYQLKSSAQVS